MLLNEARLRELYAAGEIELADLERSLDVINQRKSTELTVRSRAGSPMTDAERREVSERIAQSTGPRRRQAPNCPTCRSEIRQIVEHGVPTAWCPGCNAYIGDDPRDTVPAPDERASDVWIVGGFFPLGN